MNLSVVDMVEKSVINGRAQRRICCSIRHAPIRVSEQRLRVSQACIAFAWAGVAIEWIRRIERNKVGHLRHRFNLSQRTKHKKAHGITKLLLILRARNVTLQVQSSFDSTLPQFYHVFFIRTRRYLAGCLPACAELHTKLQRVGVRAEKEKK